MAKKIFYDDDARNRVLGGAKALYDAVKVTYGPKGGNVVIARAYGSPNVTHDGVTVAESIELQQSDDETLGYEAGARWIKEAAAKLNKVAGDGTTTVTVLTYQILKEANRLIAAGHNPQELRRGIEAAGAEALAIVTELAEDISDSSERIAEVATISAGDEAIGKLIAEVISKIGKDGVATVEPGQGRDVEKEIVEGYTFERGWASPFFMTDPAEQTAEYSNPVYIITMQKLHAAAELFPLIEKCVESGNKNIVVIANELDSEALNMLIVNKLKGAANIVAVKPPSYGDRRLAVLEDIAALVGATVISEAQSVDEVDLHYIGKSHKIIVGKEDTTIIEGAGPREDVDARIEDIRKQASAAKDDYDKDVLTGRAAALAGKVAVIRVGGATETEIDERKYRVDDAVAATKAALAEGIVAGGGVTLLNVAKRLKPATAGHELLIAALKQPFLHIMDNSGLNGHALLDRVMNSDADGQGVDVNDPVAADLVDLKSVGVVDPARVTKEAIQSAVSIAATAATMGALVVEIPEKVDPNAAAGMGY